MANKKKKKTRVAPSAVQTPPLPKSAAVREDAAAEPTQSATQRTGASRWLGLIAVLVGVLSIWAYWPTLVWMEYQWRTEPDYSHGYIVIPLALVMLYLRRDLFPGWAGRVSWGGFSLLFLAVALRILGRFAYFDFLDGWTIACWCAGLVWVFGGWHVLVWSAPAIAFLVLLVPLPFRAESLLSWRLQGVATTLSVVGLQILGFAAIPEGNTIWLDDHQMFVEEACSGLRIFVGMGAMAYFFAVTARRAWIDKLVILASAPLIAIAVNVIRVMATVLAYRWLGNGAAHFAHDFFGVVMILLGAILLMAVKSYWEQLYRPLTIYMPQRQIVLES